MRTVMRRPAALAQPVGALSLVPGDPFVAGLSAHAVALARSTMEYRPRSQSVTNRMRSS